MFSMLQVVRTALRDAACIASLITTAEAVITFKPIELKEKKNKLTKEDEESGAKEEEDEEEEDDDEEIKNFI